MPYGKIENFDLSSRKWTIYVNRVKQFIALNEIKSSLHVATLITVVGESTYDLMCDLCAPEKPEDKTFDVLVDIIQKHLEPRRSEIAERHIFRLRRQKPGEDLSTYLQNLKHLACTCNFAENLEVNLRDQFVSGLANDEMRSRIFAEEDLDYKRAVELALALEAAERHAVTSSSSGMVLGADSGGAAGSGATGANGANAMPAQITPLSPKWRNAIERRIEDERQLTMQAVGDGARIKPGEFWSLPGTFLFTVYVMTALGFGAPVPHTLWGRTSALVYAVLAIPTHIYLMVNASTCVVAHFEAYARHLRDRINGEGSELTDSNFNKRDMASNSRNSELIKSSKWNARKSIICCLGVIGVGRCIPLATVSYYTLGLVSFGVLRGKSPSETFMFPLEFTTTGGLEHVEGYVRILYGFYVEGAMCLLACVLATVRRNSSSAFACLSQTHRLFETDACEDCVKTTNK